MKHRTRQYAGIATYTNPAPSFDALYAWGDPRRNMIMMLLDICSRPSHVPPRVIRSRYGIYDMPPVATGRMTVEEYEAFRKEQAQGYYKKRREKDAQNRRTKIYATRSDKGKPRKKPNDQEAAQGYDKETRSEQGQAKAGRARAIQREITKRYTNDKEGRIS